MNKKSVVISGYYGFGNFGDESILKVLVDNLRKEKCCVTIISKNPKVTSCEHFVKAIHSFSLFRILFAIKQSDALISGGGSLLQDATSARSLLYYLFIINIALLFKKKVIIFSQGIGPISNPLLKLLTQNTLKKCRYSSVRDEKSLFLLRGWGMQPELVNDPIWGLNTPPNAPEGKVGVQLRAWKTLKDDFLFALAKQIVTNYPDKEIVIFSFQDSVDLNICTHFENILNLLAPEVKTRIVTNRSIDEVIKEVSKLDAMIAMRFHAALICVKMGIKTLALCYDVKVEKLAQDAKIPHIFLTEKDKLEESFNLLKSLRSSELLKTAASKNFCFDSLNKALDPDSKTSIAN